MRLASEEYLNSFAALTLDLLQADVPRWDEPRVLQVPEVLSGMFLWMDKSRVSDVPKIFFELQQGKVSSSSAGQDDEEEFESRSRELVFKAGKDLVDRSNVDGSWERKEPSDEWEMIAETECKKFSFPLDEVREEGGKVTSFEVSLWSSADFEVLSLKTKDVD